MSINFYVGNVGTYRPRNSRLPTYRYLVQLSKKEGTCELEERWKSAGEERKEKEVEADPERRV